MDPVPFTVSFTTTGGQDFILAEKVSLYPEDIFYEDHPLSWTIEEGSGAAALLFTRPASHQEIVLLFGIYDDEALWSEILRESDSRRMLKDEFIFRYPPQRREGYGRGAGKVYDRVTVHLSGGEFVKLVAKRCIIASLPGYKVDITVFMDEDLPH